MEQGFGTEILDYVREESGELEGAKVLFVKTREAKMKNFIMKRGFEPVDRKNLGNGRFFKILDQKN